MIYDWIYTDFNQVKFNNKVYKINIAFNRVLKAIDLLKDKDILDEDKINFCLDLLVEENLKLNMSQKNELLNKIFKEFIELKGDKKNHKNNKLMDIEMDFSYIYSSFMKDYKIDLFDELDKLNWIKFISLLQGLSKDTKMASVINIRNMKIPKPTKYNAEERKNIMELKNQYCLEQEENNFQEGLNDLFNILKGISGGGKRGKSK